MESKPEDQQLLDLVNAKIGKQQAFNLLFSNEEVIEYLSKRGLIDFLSMIGSAELREAAQIREQAAVRLLQMQRDHMLINVKDLTLPQLVKRNCQAGFLSKLEQDAYFNHYKGEKYRRVRRINLSDHQKYGMNLVLAFPNKYEVGRQSHHFNHSQFIETLYHGQDQQIEDSHQEDGNQVDNSFEQQQSDSESMFIDDREEEEESLNSDSELDKALKKQKLRKRVETPLKNLSRLKKCSEVEGDCSQIPDFFDSNIKRYSRQQIKDTADKQIASDKESDHSNEEDDYDVIDQVQKRRKKLAIESD